MSTPDETLIEKTIQVISDSGLIQEALLERYKDRLAQGMTQDDWILMTEPTSEELEGEGSA